MFWLKLKMRHKVEKTTNATDCDIRFKQRPATILHLILLRYAFENLFTYILKANKNEHH